MSSAASYFANFQPDRFARLKSLLSSLFTHPHVSQQHLKEAYAELDKARPWFLHLLRVPPQSKEEKDLVEKGTIKIASKSVRINAEFIAETLFLSSQLSLSELFSAHLLRCGISLQSRYGNRPAAETAIIVFHMERLDMLACLKLIFDPAVAQKGPLEVLERFGRELKGSLVDLGGGKEGSLVERIMVDIEGTKGLIAQLQAQANQAALGGAGPGPSTLSNTTLFAPQQSQQQQPSSTGGAKLSLEMTQERVTSLKLERKNLGHVLFLLAYSRNLRKKEIQAVVRWLSKQSGTAGDGEEVMLGYLVATVLAAFDLSEMNNPEADHEAIIQERFVKDSQFIKIMTAEIVTKTWAHQPLQSVITLQWTLFLVEAFRHNRNLEHDTAGLTEEAVELMVGNAIRGDAFQFLTHRLVGLGVESKNASTAEAGANQAQAPSSSSSSSLQRREDTVDPVFKLNILTQVDLLITNFVTTMSPILRKLKHREEDVVLASSSNSRSAARSHGASTSTTTATPMPRADVEALFTLIAAVYRDSPLDAGLKYWHDADGRLFAFLRWAADARTPGMIRALFEMLASLSVGPQSSTFAFNFLAAGSGESGSVCSWSSLFNALSFYAGQLPKINENVQAAMQPGLPQPRRDPNAPSTIPPDEISLLKSFLRLLKNVVHSSPVARAALYENQQFKAVPTILSLVNSVVPIDFKASLFDTLAAFCGPEGGALGVDIARQMWVTLERYEIIPTKFGSSGPTGLYRSSSLASSRQGASGGIIAELEDAETAARTYPATASFVHLLNSLIHTPAKSATILTGLEVESHTIPETLGSGSRTPGIAPYVRYVLDDVFLRAPKLVFADPAERWKLIERSLCFAEKCLATYDLSPLLAEEALGISSLTKGHQRHVSTSLTGLALHPGFEILRRLLTEPALLKGLLDVLAVGLDGLSDDAGKTPALGKSVLRSLRIVHRILQIQGLFIEVLLPTLADSQQGGLGSTSYPTSVAPLDQHLLYAHPVVVQIALLVNYIEDPELVLLSIKTLSLLSQSPFFVAVDRFENIYSSQMNRLVGIIDSSDESLRILDGFVQRLGTESEDDELPQESTIESLVVSDDHATAEPQDFTEKIRFAILDLLLKNTTPGVSGPNIAHFLCGFNLNRPPSEMEIDDPQAQGTRLSCLHIVFDLLAQGAPRPDDEDRSEYDEGTLLARNPALAERCSRLVHQLCVHDLTASATTRYIRTREDYCYRQLSVLPMIAPEVATGPLGHAVYSNGSRVHTSASAVVSFLRFRSGVLDISALELHLINPTGLHAAKLVDALFTSPSSLLDDFEAGLYNGEMAEQPLTRILDVLQSLDFEWQDDIPDTDMRLAFFASLDFSTCLQVDESGCEVYDFRALLSAMNAVKRQLQRMGALSGQNQQDALKLETRGVLRALAVENHRRQINHAKHECLVSWQRVLDVILFKSFELIPLDQRESVLFDLLQTVFHVVTAPETQAPTAELLCQVLLSLITKLRQGRRQQALLSEHEDLGGVLPTDKLLAILRSVLDCITRAGTTELVRGNLYTVLINYLQLVSSFSSSADSVAAATKAAPASLEVTDDGLSVDGGEPTISTTFRPGQHSPLEIGTLSILTSAMEKLAPVVCRDALDGSEIWKTVAYTALESLVTATKEDRTHRLISVLSRSGYLQSFVQSLRDSEDDLLSMLLPDPDNLNSLYVYEAKTSLLVRIAQSRFGADRLIEARVFEVLSQCTFVDARPEMDQTYLDLDSFLPPVIERYHQLLLPVLQLAVGILSSLGSSSHPSIQQALGFISAHRETILLILKDSTAIVPLPVLKEFHLLSTLFLFVLPQVEPSDLTLPSGFGAYHLALLGLGGRFFLREKWEDQVIPLNDAERAQAEIPSPDGRGSVFERNADHTVEDLHKSLLSYFVLSTEPKGSQALRPVLSPTVSGRETGLVPKHGAATISSAIALLYETTIQLSSAVDQIRDFALKLSQPSALSADEIDEIVAASNAGSATRYSTAQRHQLALSALASLKRNATESAHSSLFIVETLLLLLWRHLFHYLSESLQDGPPSSWATILPSSVSLRFSQGPGATQDLLSSKRGGVLGGKEMWDEASRELGPSLGRLEGVDLSTEVFGSDARIRQSYLAILIRRLRELETIGGDDNNGRS